MNDLLILCYHAVDPAWPAELSVTPDALELQLGELARAGYRGARLSDALEQRPSGRVVAVTFDDSYRSVLELAKPLLDRHGFPGTIFVPTDWAGAERPMTWDGIEHWLGTPHEHALHPLGWQELGELADGGWEIASHTCSHPHLPEVEDGSLAHELAASKALIEERLSRPCTALAYPYGEVDARVRAATQRAGYRWATTIPRVLPRAEPLLWPRIPIYHDDDMRRFRTKVSPSLRRLRASPPGRVLDRLRISRAQADAGRGTGA